jgi:hypothetical protein
MLLGYRVGARLALLVVATIAVGAPSASAAGWTPVTGSIGGGTRQIAEVRTSDGTLHLAWARDDAGGIQDLLSAAISPAGVVQPATTVVAGYGVIGNPGIVAGAGGALTIYFGAVQCSASTCPSGLLSTTSTDGGATWSSPTVVLNADQVYASDVNAATLADGTPFQAWAHTTATTVHRGTTAGTDYDFQGAMGAGCCGYASNLAVDPAGNVQLAWYSNATNFEGVWSRAVDPSTGAPSGSPQQMPGSVTTYNGQPSSSPINGRTPIAALPGGGFDVAYSGGYPEQTKVLLWRVGDTGSTTVVDEPGAHTNVSLAVDAQSRVWVFWTLNQHVFAGRVDPGGTLEPPIDLGAPTGTAAILALDGSVDQAGDPEVLALASLSDGTYGTYYIRGSQTAPVPPPVLGQSVDAAVVTGTVLIQLPAGATARDALTKGSGFVPLTAPRALPTGTSVDARAGTIQLVTATASQGKTQTGSFGGGLFRIGQSARGLSKGLTTLAVVEDAFPGAPGYAQCHGAAAAGPALDPHLAPFGFAAAASPSKKVLQTLNAHDSGGRFATRTKASAATVRGTNWTTIDRCGGTITSVRRGVVSVFAFRTRKTVRVTAGHSYYAKLP